MLSQAATADFVAREGLGFDEQDRASCLGQLPGQECAGRPCADHHRIPVMGGGVAYG